ASWTVVYTWVNGNDDNAYHFYDIDLSPYSLTSRFWIAFQANMADTADYFYVDNIEVLWIFNDDLYRPIAADDFESGGWSGGYGWLADWTQTGDSTVTTSGTPYEGSYHMLLQNNTGYASRSVDLSGHTNVRLRFWAKANSFEAGETAQALISPNGTDWTVVYTWVNGDDDNVYRFYDIDLSAFSLTSQFWIAFQANLSSTFDYFYVDDIQVVDVSDVIADDFESGGWSGGTGWLAAWTQSGDSSVTTSGAPYEGSYHMMLRNSTGYAARSADLSGHTSARLQFWAKAYSFEAGETAELLVSENGTDWTVVYTWVDGDDDDVYRFYDIDLSTFSLTSQFWIAWQANLSSTWDNFYVDDIRIVDAVEYGIISRAGNEIIKSVVKIISGEPYVNLWWIY
ncbi:MAG: hypothetical protein ABID71_09975, partial [Chloroflexota bacterium]